MEAQTFQQLCNTNYSDFNGTNPGMRDLLSVFTRTFDECMTLCAQYNRQYQQHQIDEKAYIKPEGYCRAVSMNKYPIDLGDCVFRARVCLKGR
ncbi:hypothetical protein PG984_006830 [Apiospora sp. TS-2023a]